MYKLLTPEEKKKVKSEYRFRLLTTIAALISGIGLFGILSLIPALILTSSERDTANSNLNLAAESSKVDSDALKNWALTMRQKLIYLTPNKTPDLPYEWYLKVLAEKPSGVTLNNLTYQDQSNKIAIRIRGVAKDRETLILFQNKLDQSGNFVNFTFPVDTLAKDTNIDFDFSLTPLTS